eukprot:TRINITY_DN23449_c0_g1_i1.p1 TRINITY_DN23449_c0_g1~~TRINITY_DN23449_c0_g1_i1.p1  ORF type:complete len:617 (+),score=105.86 TRINITY_DN23449_c0_g1_i1:50-1852(+)
MVAGLVTKALSRVWKSKEPSGPDTLTAVLLAPTQAGKSTTADEIYAIQCEKRPSETGDVEIGNGRVSCTRSPKLLASFAAHSLVYHKEATQFLEKAPSDAIALSPEQMEELNEARLKFKNDLDWSASVCVNKDAPFATKVGQHTPIQLLDTPGGDDSSGLDDLHIEEILDMMCSDQVTHISAFLLISKVGQPFAHGWLKCVDRYWNQFPTFRRNWIFVHTGSDPTKTDFDNSCFEHDNAVRRQDFLEVLMRELQDEDGILPTLPHIFIDNVVPAEAKILKDPTLRYGLELKKASRAHAQNKIIAQITQNEPVKVEALAYRKSDSQIVVDNVLIARFEACMQGLRRHEEYLQPLLEDRRLALIGAREELARGKARLADAEKELAMYNNEELVMVDERKYRPSRALLRSSEDEYVVTCAKPIARQTLTVEVDSCLSKACFCLRNKGAEGFAVDDGIEVDNSKTWSATVKVMGRAMPSKYLISHKLWVEKRFWHSDVVLKRQSIVNSCKEELVELQNQEAHVQDEIDCHRIEVETTRKQLAFLEKHCKDLAQSDIPLPLYRALKGFYLADHGNKQLDSLYFDALELTKVRNELFQEAFFTEQS